MARAGRFNTRARFLRPPASDDADLDDYGNEVDADLTEIATVWADVRTEEPGGEGLGAGRLEATKKIRLRVYDSTAMRGVSGGDRVEVIGETWNLSAPGYYIDPKRTVLEFTGMAGAAV